MYSQGRYGKAVYAKTAVSASPNWVNDDCITVVDHTLMFAIEHDADRHWTVLTDRNDAQRWEVRLIALADDACRKTASEHGESLIERLAEYFATFDRYVANLGDLRSILDSEFNFVQAASDKERKLTELWSIGKNDDWRLACHVLIRYASPQVLPLFDLRLHDCSALRTLLYLLADHVTATRAASSTP